jgi:septum formation protein
MRSRPLVLASGSPRRRALLREAGFRFEVRRPHVDEQPLPGERPDDLVRRLSVEKARAVSHEVDPRACVLASDTVVVLDGEILGKPRDVPHAIEMLSRIAGRTHTVYTGFAALVPETGSLDADFITSDVSLRAIASDELEAYVATGEPLDKAGSYALQGEGGRFVRDVRGSRSNVIGLPLETVVPVLERLGVQRSC